MNVRKYNETGGVFHVDLSPREMELLSERELPELDGDTDIDRAVRTELKAAAETAIENRRAVWAKQKTDLEAARNARFLESWKRRLDNQGLSLASEPDADGNRVALTEAGEAAFTFANEGQFRRNLQRWIFA